MDMRDFVSSIFGQLGTREGQQDFANSLKNWMSDPTSFYQSIRTVVPPIYGSGPGGVVQPMPIPAAQYPFIASNYSKITGLPSINALYSNDRTGVMQQ